MRGRRWHHSTKLYPIESTGLAANTIWDTVTHNAAKFYSTQTNRRGRRNAIERTVTQAARNTVTMGNAVCRVRIHKLSHAAEGMQHAACSITRQPWSCNRV